VTDYIRSLTPISLFFAHLKIIEGADKSLRFTIHGALKVQSRIQRRRKKNYERDVHPGKDSRESFKVHQLLRLTIPIPVSAKDQELREGCSPGKLVFADRDLDPMRACAVDDDHPRSKALRHRAAPKHQTARRL